MSLAPPPAPPASPEDEPNRPRRVIRFMLTRFSPISPQDSYPGSTTGAAGSDTPDPRAVAAAMAHAEALALLRARRPYVPAEQPGPLWLRRSAALARERLALQGEVARFIYGQGATALWMQVLALPVAADPMPPTAETERRHQARYAELLRIAAPCLRPDETEPGLALPQATVDAAQCLLWLLRHDRRHRTTAHRLLYARTAALRDQVMRGDRELVYPDLPTRADVLLALDRTLTWLRVLNLGDVSALGLAPAEPEQPMPPAYEAPEASA
jgi:hypothetical protein